MTDKPTHTPLPELLPCPFCGAKDARRAGVKDAILQVLHTEAQGPGYASYWSVECDGCCTQGSPQKTKAEALTAWNTRAVNSHHDLIEALEALSAEVMLLRIAVQTDDPKREVMLRISDIDKAIRAILTKAEAGHG